MSYFDWRENQGVAVPSNVETIAKRVIGAAIEVHRVLGPGLLESHYQKALSHELTLRGVPHVREAEYDVLYKGEPIGKAFFDFLIEDRLIVELKAVETLSDLHRSQVITYLRLRDMPLALLINYNVSLLRDGIRRVINTH